MLGALPGRPARLPAAAGPGGAARPGLADRLDRRALRAVVRSLADPRRPRHHRRRLRADPAGRGRRRPPARHHPPGTYPLYGWTSLAVFVKERMVEAAGNWLSGTLLWPRWLRGAGMRVGRNCEISTIIDVDPGTGRDRRRVPSSPTASTSAGPAAPRHAHRSRAPPSATNTFLGNHVVIRRRPAAPRRHPDRHLARWPMRAEIRPGTSWFGHPTFELPRREVVAMDRHLTHDPGALRYASRCSGRGCASPCRSCRCCSASPGCKRCRAAPSIVGTAGLFSSRCPAGDACAAPSCARRSWPEMGAARPGQAGQARRSGRAGAAAGISSTSPGANYAAGRSWSCSRAPCCCWSTCARSGMKLGRRVVLAPASRRSSIPTCSTIGDGATVCACSRLTPSRTGCSRSTPSASGATLTVGGRHRPPVRRRYRRRRPRRSDSVVMKHETLLSDQYYVGCPTRAGRAPE